MAPLPKTDPARPLPSFTSSDVHLNDGFRWAIARATQWVRRPEEGGMPAYWAGYPDRAMFYSRDVAHQALGGHLLGLHRENFAMLKHFVSSSNEARKYYPLWSFNFDGTLAEIDYHSDENFVREVPAVFELAEKSLEQALWTADDRYLTDPAFASYYDHVVNEFVQLHDELGIGVAGASGTRDIFRGMASYNEQEGGAGLKIAGDGISSQWAAFARIARQLPEHPASARAAVESHRLKGVFEGDWWDDRRACYATGITAEGPTYTFAHEPSWFPATKGMLEPGRRADRHLRFLGAELFANPPSNIEAFTYLPEAFFAYDHDDVAIHWIRHLIDSKAEYPEVSFTLVAHLLTGLTGLRPLSEDLVETKSHFPGGRLEVSSVPFRDHLLDVQHDGSEATTLAVRGGNAAVRWRAWNNGRCTETLVAPDEQVRVDGSRHS